MDELKNFPCSPPLPPGETIYDFAEEQGIGIEELVQRLDKSVEFTWDLLKGRAQIDEELAQILSDKIGSSKDFWVNREKFYREDLKNARRS